jgi:hypothetical protein
VNAGLGVGIALHTDRAARSLAGAGVSLGALSAHGQSAQMANATIALDGLHALQVETNLTAKVTFDDILALLNRVNDLGKLGFRQVLGANARIDVGRGQDLLRVGRTEFLHQ